MKIQKAQDWSKTRETGNPGFFPAYGINPNFASVIKENRNDPGPA